MLKNIPKTYQRNFQILQMPRKPFIIMVHIIFNTLYLIPSTTLQLIFKSSHQQEKFESKKSRNERQISYEISIQSLQRFHDRQNTFGAIKNLQASLRIF
jgi:hypothetical protein